MKSYDVIVIGAGHNGMVAAACLAKAGKSVLVLEACPTYGGMARHGEFAPGFPGAPLVHTVNGPIQNLIDELELEIHGLAGKLPVAKTHCLSPDAPPLSLDGAYEPAAGILDNAEAAEWQELRSRLLFQSGLLQRFLQDVPPQEDAFPLAMKMKLAKTAFSLKRAGKVELQEFLRMAMMCVADVANETLDDDRLKGLLAFDATLGINLGPRSPTSLFGLYYRLASSGVDRQQMTTHSSFASHALTTAIHDAAKIAGAEFIFGSEVKEIVVQDGVATAVVTADETRFNCQTIVSAVHPQTTFVGLVGAPKLGTGFARDISSIRSKGNVSKLNLVLENFPVFEGIHMDQANGRYVYAPSVNHVEHNFNPSKYGALPDDPCFEFVVDEAEEGRFYLSIQIQNTPYDLREGWKTGEGKLRKRVMSRLETLSPGIGKAILASSFHSPVDIESRFNVPGGHWHHGELQMDRVFSLRPVFGAANYRTPISHLYLCGAGTHPGGGLNGISGMNAAKAVLVDEGSAA